MVSGNGRASNRQSSVAAQSRTACCRYGDTVVEAKKLLYSAVL